jgi:NADPH oxidase
MLALHLLWWTLQPALFSLQFTLIHKSRKLVSLRMLMGWTLALAKASAININLSSAMLVMSRLPVLLEAVNRRTGLDKMHKWFGVCLVFWSAVHCLAHTVNYARVKSTGMLRSGTTITGILLSVFLLIIWITSMERVRTSARYFRLFKMCHFLLAPFLVTQTLHGTFCLLRQDTGKCNSPTSWKWLVGPVTLWLLDQTLIQWRIWTRRSVLKRVIVHPSQVVELQFDMPKLRFQPGQYVNLKVPLVSMWEWHPFTLTSSPHDELHSVHIRVTGKWTRSLANLLHIEYKTDGTAFCQPLSCLPDVMIDGPYGHGWSGVVEESRIEDTVIICIGAGIGQTPFASILKTWWYFLNSIVYDARDCRHNYEQLNCKRIIMYAISRETQV